MRNRTVTFDFHNTIVLSDAWFQVEVYDLPGAWLHWYAAERGDPPNDERIERANTAYRRLRKAIHAHGHELSAEACLDIVLHEVGVEASPETIAAGTDAIMRDTLAGIAPVPGVIELIEELDAHGIRLGIVSSAVHHPFLLWSLDLLGVTDAFGAIVTSASAGYYKSRPEIYWSALNELGASPSRSLHLGDSARFDVVTARRAGMQTAWLQRPGASPLPDDEGASVTFQSLVGAAPRLLERL